jgi:5-methyltetrahydropteroyltriglutamate--homocysteine methyltransferase
MVRAHVLGYPRVGEKRELKFALEAYWRGDIAQQELESTGRTLRSKHWAQQRAFGLDYVTVGDFAFYDHVANHIQLFDCEPKRFGFKGDETQLDRYFTMARGVASGTVLASNFNSNHAHDAHCDCGGDNSGNGAKTALEMTKWFDTNYHYLVPEFSVDTTFRIASERLFHEVQEALDLGHPVKVALIGPVTFLWLGKEKQNSFDRLTLLESLLEAYETLLARLKALGVAWVQLDEPILGLDLTASWKRAVERSYWQLGRCGINVMVATYFSSLEDNLRLACALPIAGLHIDAIRAPGDLLHVSDWLPAHKVLSVGIIDGRNIWRTRLDAAITTLEAVREKHKGALWIAPSCSLLHVPYSLRHEQALDNDIRSWMAFAEEKLEELNACKAVLNGDALSVRELLTQNRAALDARASSARVHNAEVAARLVSDEARHDARHSSFSKRQTLQLSRFKLPPLPTTTIGSFPQTQSIRAARSAFRRGDIDNEHYQQTIRVEISNAVAIQERIGLDVLVHGEAERNDMVEYFGEQLSGYAFTENGWVQSYGSRCVKPPLIYGDVSRPHAMTVAWTSYAQSLSQKPVKGMLTGPITMLQWSFVRDDQARSTTALQIALAIRDEVLDLERANIGIIQIDEPAIREGLPLRRSQWSAYLEWATRAFRICASGVRDDTQIHTHMCYAEFNDILSQIAAMDADVITIETSRSDMELLQGFSDFNYPNEIGPGVYDIHSPRVPSTDEMLRLLRKASNVFPLRNLWVNPDCGLKTRSWPETEAALRNMVDAAHALRAEIA